MLSNKVISYCRQQNWWFDDASESYRAELQKLGISESSEFGEFFLHAEDGPTFLSGGIEIYQVCWFSKNTNFQLALQRAHNTLSLGFEYIPLDSFEGEGGFFYNKETEEVVELSLGKNLADFKSGKLTPQWTKFSDFLEFFFKI